MRPSTKVPRMATFGSAVRLWAGMLLVALVAVLAGSLLVVFGGVHH